MATTQAPARKRPAPKKTAPTGTKADAGTARPAKTPAKKTPVTKAAPAKTPPRATKVTHPRTAQATAPTKKAPAKSPAKKSAPVGRRASAKTEQGYVAGSARDVVAQAIMAGGDSRQAVLDKLKKHPMNNTSLGTERNWSIVLSSVIRDFKESGWKEEGTWRIAPGSRAKKFVAIDRTNRDGDGADAAPAARKKAAPRKSPAPKAKTAPAASAPKRKAPAKKTA